VIIFGKKIRKKHIKKGLLILAMVTLLLSGLVPFLGVLGQ